MWCKRKVARMSEDGAVSGCKTFDEFNLLLTGSKFDDLDNGIALGGALALPVLGDPDRRAYVIEHSSMIVRWLDGLKEACLADALAGLPTGGLKAVAGRRAAAKWNDKEAAARAALEHIGVTGFTQRLKSPTKIGKEIEPEDFKEHFVSLVEFGEPKPTLVPEADARPALIPVQSKFDEEEGTE
jgi:hypothetical protein